MIITRKIEIYSTNKEFNQKLFELNKVVYRMKNRIMQRYYLADAQEHLLIATQAMERKDFNGEWYKANYGMSKQNLGYDITKHEFSEVSSYIRSAVSNSVFQDWKNDVKDVMSGKRSQRTYKFRCPINFTKSSITSLTQDEFFWMGYNVIFKFGKDKSGNRNIIKSIIDGKYKLCDSAIQIQKVRCEDNKERSKIFLLLCVDIPASDHSLKPDVVAMVDISWKHLMTLTNNADSQTVIVEKEKELQMLRIQLNRRYEKSQGRQRLAMGGHGRKRKLKGLEFFHNLEKGIANTFNHQMTKLIIDRVVHKQAGKLVVVGNPVELPENQPDRFSRNFVHRFWGYHQIIEKLQYKCKLHGIEFENRFKTSPEETAA